MFILSFSRTLRLKWWIKNIEALFGWFLSISMCHGHFLTRNGLKSSSLTMVFCYQNCSDLLWEKIVLVIEKFFWNSRLKAICKKFEITRTICSNSERSEQFLVTDHILTKNDKVDKKFKFLLFLTLKIWDIFGPLKN